MVLGQVERVRIKPFKSLPTQFFDEPFFLKVGEAFFASLFSKKACEAFFSRAFFLKRLKDWPAQCGGRIQACGACGTGSNPVVGISS